MVLGSTRCSVQRVDRECNLIQINKMDWVYALWLAASLLNTSRSLDRRPTSRNVQVSVRIILRRERVSTCEDVVDGSDVASLFSLQECQIKHCKANGTCF